MLLDQKCPLQLKIKRNGRIVKTQSPPAAPSRRAKEPRFLDHVLELVLSLGILFPLQLGEDFEFT
jgi:hypothetical protein